MDHTDTDLQLYMHVRHIHVNSLYSGISDWLWMRFQLGELLGMTSAICTNRFSQNKSSVFKVFFAIFSKDLFSDYFGPTCGKHAWLLYIFSETVRFRQPTVVDWIGWVKEQLRVTIIHPIPTSYYWHQNVIFQTIQRFASTYMLKSVLQYSRGLETILRSTLNHWTVINTIILSLCTVRD